MCLGLCGLRVYQLVADVHACVDSLAVDRFRRPAYYCGGMQTL